MEFAEAFNKAYAIRFDPKEIDWKPTFSKGKEGAPLAYLNWATAWAKFAEIYPEGHIEILEHDGDPLWVSNGYGFVKVRANACGFSYTEVFPIMQGGANDAVKIEEIDGRDVNDSIQRAITKVIARFGIGLYIYEGKLEAKAPTFPQSQQEKPKEGYAASQKQKDTIKSLMEERGKTLQEYGLDTLDSLTSQQASNLISNLFKLPKVEKKKEPKSLEIPEPDPDDLSF